MKQTSWQIIYTNYSKMQKRAIEFLNREMSKYVLRELGEYKIHVLPVYKESSLTVENSAIVLSLYNDSNIIKNYIKPNEFNENGFILKVIDNPNTPESSLVLITANNEDALYRGAVYFMDDYVTKYSPMLSGKLRYRFFDGRLVPGEYKEQVLSKTRSIFAWGHAINDYRAYIDNMARLGLNQLILWNDYEPLNARDIVEYAHSYNIEVIWGFAWGWDEKRCENLTDLNDEMLEKMKISALDAYYSTWQGLGDGIYFQSFTETNMDTLNGKCIASVVTDFVNDIAGIILEKEPNLKIQFGLHALSVHKYIHEIARVDKRIEILWEDCGDFPYSYGVFNLVDEEKFKETVKFTKDIIELRGVDSKTGIVFKGHTTLDWTRFIHQKGPFILGENSNFVKEHDKYLRSSGWNTLSAGWIKNGERARLIADLALTLTNGNVNLCMAGAYDGGIFLPMALCAEIFKNPTEKFEDILERVNGREVVEYK
ncbi:MAG: hypothetical protein IKV61_01330 [Clostridia bacterium]|nr:hypothetical protein [Clostridia bacterium]